MIKASLKHIRAMEKILSDIERKIQEKIDCHYKEEYALLQTIAGVKGEASTLIAEMGVDMKRFPSEEHLSSWAGMSPGNNESGGKKKPGSTRYGNKCLKTMLTEFAWVTSKTKDTYLRSKYHSPGGRRGKKKALVALGQRSERSFSSGEPAATSRTDPLSAPPKILPPLPANLPTLHSGSVT